MTLSVSRLQLPIIETNTQSVGFRNLIENHILYLQSDPTTSLMPLNAHDEDKYTGDFYQLLFTMNIPQDIWWITMRVNNLHSPLDYNGNLQQIFIPSFSKIKTLLTRYINTVTIL